jgi:hypothetical protein
MDRRGRDRMLIEVTSLDYQCLSCSLKYLEWVIMYTIVFTEVPEVSDHVCDCVHWSTWSERSCIRLCSLKYHSLQVLQWTQSYTWSLTAGTLVNTIVYMITHYRYFSEHNRIHDHSLQVLQWTQSSTWSERSCIRLCSLKYLEWVIMYTLTPGTSVNTIVYMITHFRYFSEHKRIHDHSLQVLQWTQSYTWSRVHWSTWSEWSCIRLCSLKYLEWVIMYTIVFTEVPEVSDHVYDCVHWSTWSEWSCIRLCSLKYLEWVITLTPGTPVNTIVYMITHFRYFSEHNRIHDHSLQVLQWTQSYTWSLTSGTSVNTIVFMITHSRYFFLVSFQCHYVYYKRDTQQNIEYNKSTIVLI